MVGRCCLLRAVLADQLGDFPRECVEIDLRDKDLERFVIFADHLQIKGHQLLGRKLIVQLSPQPQNLRGAHEQLAELRVGGSNRAMIIVETAAVGGHQLLQSREVRNIARKLVGDRGTEAVTDGRGD